MIVLDASAVLALLRDERGAEQVEDAVASGALISSVNLSEVLAKLADAGADVDAAAGLMGGLFVEIVPFGLASAREAAHVRRLASSSGLSLGDRACLALSRARNVPTLTADRAWAGIATDLDVEVRVIR